MFGLISACAFADTTPKVEVKMPTLATMRACFIVYLRFIFLGPTDARENSNARRR
jgi:hypothetical protein